MLDVHSYSIDSLHFQAAKKENELLPTRKASGTTRCTRTVPHELHSAISSVLQCGELLTSLIRLSSCPRFRCSKVYPHTSGNVFADLDLSAAQCAHVQQHQAEQQRNKNIATRCCKRLQTRQAELTRQTGHCRMPWLICEGSHVSLLMTCPVT
jgi:hypothetical protein